MNKYTIENSQPMRNGKPIRLSHLVDDINHLAQQNKKLIEENAQLYKDKMKATRALELIIKETDNGEEM